MWKVILGWLKNLFTGGTAQIGSRNQSASDITVGDNASVVAVGQGITVHQPRQEPEIPFATLEQQLPALLAEMRKDLKENPFAREFVLLGKHWMYNPDPNKPVLNYVFEEHPHLRDKLRMLEQYNLIQEITFNKVDRFIFSEEFVSYLTK